MPEEVFHRLVDNYRAMLRRFALSLTGGVDRLRPSIAQETYDDRVVEFPRPKACV